MIITKINILIDFHHKLITSRPQDLYKPDFKENVFLDSRQILYTCINYSQIIQHIINVATKIFLAYEFALHRFFNEDDDTTNTMLNYENFELVLVIVIVFCSVIAKLGIARRGDNEILVGRGWDE